MRDGGTDVDDRYDTLLHHENTINLPQNKWR